MCQAVLPAMACQICLPFPRESAADKLIDAEIVVLAREDPAKPFSLKPGEVLKGRVGWQSDTPITSAELRLFYYTKGKGTRDVDVVVVGAGNFGMWTAFYLTRLGANSKLASGT